MSVFALPALRPAALLLAAALALAACDSRAERAEAHYQRGLEFVASGDVDRAKIEFRNVFRLNGEHTQARLAFARLLRDGGDPVRAMSHYLLLVEQDRDNLDAQRELAELALTLQDFAAAAEATKRAYALAPDDPGVRALKATLDYRDGDRAAATAMAEGVLADAPGNVPAHMVLIADRMNADDPEGALARADAALEQAPGDEGLHLVRLAALERIGDEAGVGAQIARMAELFPDNASVTEALVHWRLRQGDVAGAEAALRAAAARDPGNPDPALTVVQFLYQTAGAAAAQAELDRLAETAADPLPFRRARAGLDFAEGRQDEAIAALRALTEGPASEDGDAAGGALSADDIRDIQTELAAMLGATGDAAGRDALVETVLAGDAGHVAALKLRARARIEADAPDLAIQDMRKALGQAPRDPEIMTIMAMAHEREGAHELAGERLSLAVEVSDQAPEESLRYASFLMRDGRVGPAEGVLVAALRRAPDDPDLLLALGRIHAERRDWRRVDQVADLLRGQGGPAAAMATELAMASLAGQDRADAALSLLQDLAGDGGDAAAMGQLVQAHVAAGDLAAAQAYLDGVLAADPDSLPGRMLQAGLFAAEGETAAAEALYRTLIDEDPALPQPHRALVALLSGPGGDPEAAEAALEAGLAATEGDRDLMFLQAGLREARGDFDGAIAVYETLYARDSANPLIANNLASLIASQRDDADGLERAFAIARRLRGSDVPQFQDTYGWILHRRGDPEGALAYLEPAAAALGDNALVQYHLGEALFALGRTAPARERLARAVEIAEARPEQADLPLDAARARIAEIDALPAPAAPAGPATDG